MRLSPARPGTPLRCAGALPGRTFSAEERAVLAPHFTNLDRPVFALVNLPETVKGALFARYSRYSGSVRRSTWRSSPAMPRRRGGPSTTRRASEPRSSTSASSSATATTRSPRSAAPTSPASGSRTSSRSCCSAAASPPTWSSRPATSPMTSRCPARAATASTATGARPGVRAPRWTSCSGSTRARSSRSRAGRPSAGRAATGARGGLAALDPGQGAGPAARPAAGGHPQPRRHLRVRPGLRAADLAPDGLAAAGGPRVRRHDPHRAEQVMPSFVSRVDRPDRGGEWISYLERRREQTERGSPGSASTAAGAARAPPRSS